ncbi:MAG: hypothetical protein LBT04_07530 [Prevotellaceae bacterium]|jgi:hypothetical protein|nr:hypothetical protein [Prevotellaceae bacterium]
MKRISILIIGVLSLVSTSFYAQNCEIPLIPLVQDGTDPLPVEAKSFLEDKLTQIIVRNGISAGNGYGQFYLLAKISLLSKDIVQGSPVMISQRLNLSLYIVDYSGEKVIAATTMEVQAVGTNETKSCINGIRSINAGNDKLQTFIQEGKEKMLNYYDNNYAVIIKKAQQLASMKHFEEALFNLTSIPECSKGYDAAIAACNSIFQSHIDDLCKRNLMLAKTAWAAEQNAEGARVAGEYLTYIYPDANCYPEAIALYKEIKSRIRENWTFELKQYDDTVSLEKQRINAYREVGVAFGKGQQPTTTNLMWSR